MNYRIYCRSTGELIDALPLHALAFAYRDDIYSQLPRSTVPRSFLK